MSEPTTPPPFNIQMLKDVLDFMSPKTYTTDETDEIPKFMVLFGKNGVGKTRLLKAIQQHIVNQENAIFPNMIVRKLAYGEEPDRYDPNTTEHPLVTKEMIESFFKCNFNNWENLTKGEPVKGKLDEVYKIYETEIVKNQNFPNKPQECYFFEFRKYFRRQILKKICFGSLEQLLMLNLPYDFDIKKINDSLGDFENKYKVKFDYKIVKNRYGIVEKLNLNELIEFEQKTQPNFRIKFNQLSPGEKLILHFLLIYKDKDKIKIDKSKIDSNQVLLLDEPDSHCEPDLVVNLVRIIKELLVNEMNIQVIMTSHNTTTMFSLQFDEKIYLLENIGNDKVKFSKKDRDSTRDILAKNTDYAINFMSLSFYNHYNLTRDFFHDLGNCFEYLIKKMTRNDQIDFNFSQRKELFEKLLVCNNLNFENVEIDENHQNLEDVGIENLTENDDKIRTYWPKSNINKAWDFMIFYKQKLYLYQVTTGKKYIKEQCKISEKVMKKLFDNESRLKYWINAKFFFVKSTIDIKIKEPSVDEVFSITEIFENLFKKGDKSENNIGKNTNQLSERNSYEPMSSMTPSSHGEKISINGTILTVNNNNNEKYEFEKSIEKVYEIDTDIFAIIFNDDIINILKLEKKNFYMIHSLIGHKNKVYDIKYQISASLLKSSALENEIFNWKIDINRSKSKENYFILNIQKKDKTNASLKTTRE